MVGQPRGVILDVFVAVDIGEVVALDILGPLVGEFLTRHTESSLKRLLDVTQHTEPVEDLTDLPLAVLLGDVPPEGLSTAIGKVSVKLLETPQVLAYGHVAHELVGLDIKTTDAGILRISFVPPEWDDGSG